MIPEVETPKPYTLKVEIPLSKNEYEALREIRRALGVDEATFCKKAIMEYTETLLDNPEYIGQGFCDNVRKLLRF